MAGESQRLSCLSRLSAVARRGEGGGGGRHRQGGRYPATVGRLPAADVHFTSERRGSPTAAPDAPPLARRTTVTPLRREALAISSNLEQSRAISTLAISNTRQSLPVGGWRGGAGWGAGEALIRAPPWAVGKHEGGRRRPGPPGRSRAAQSAAAGP